jgi:hypothetical protein
MTSVSQLFVYILSYNEHYLQPGNLFHTRILYPFHLSVNYHSSQRMSCMFDIAQGKEIGAVTVISKQLHIVNVLTRINSVV